MEEHYDLTALKPLLARAKILPEPELHRNIRYYKKYNDQKAIDVIVGSIILYVLDEAIKYKRNTYSPVEINDLVAQALFYLPKALQKYKPNKKNRDGEKSKFLLYYIWWIKAGFSEVDTNERDEKGRFHVFGDEKRIVSYKYGIKKKLDKKENVRYATFRSLEAPFRHRESSLRDVIPAPNAAEHNAEMIELREKLEEAVNSLEERCRNSFILRHGMFGNNEHCPSEIAKIEKVTKEGIRLRCKNGMRKIRVAAMENQLYYFLQ